MEKLEASQKAAGEQRQKKAEEQKRRNAETVARSLRVGDDVAPAVVLALDETPARKPIPS
jgi:hypothetical protein